VARKHEDVLRQSLVRERGQGSSYQSIINDNYGATDSQDALEPAGVAHDEPAVVAHNEPAVVAYDEPSSSLVV